MGGGGGWGVWEGGREAGREGVRARAQVAHTPAHTLHTRTLQGAEGKVAESLCPEPPLAPAPTPHMPGPTTPPALSHTRTHTHTHARCRGAEGKVAQFSASVSKVQMLR